MSSLYPTDRVYYLERAIAACAATGEAQDVIHGLRTMRDEAQREARQGSNPVSQSTGD